MRALREIFATHGIPKVVVSDNGPSFVSAEMQEFFTKNGIKHISTPPYHPASNGLVERMVQTVKGKLKKIDQGDISTRVARTLLSLRTTPLEDGATPAEKLMGRKLRTILDTIIPETPNAMARTLSKFQIEDQVWYRNYTGAARWKEGTVKEIKGKWLWIETEGHRVKRHEDQLKKKSGEECCV